MSTRQDWSQQDWPAPKLILWRHSSAAAHPGGASRSTYTALAVTWQRTCRQTTSDNVAILVDTGVLVSAADSDEPRHAACATLLWQHRGELVVPAPVVPETAWLIESRLSPAAEVRFLRLVTARALQVIDLEISDYERCIDLIEKYADLGLGLVDASLVTVAEARGITTLATLNTRDFRVVRPRHVDALTLIP